MLDISINWLTRRITVFRSFMTLVSGVLYTLDINELRLTLKDIEDNPDGMGQPDTHRHNTEVTLGGVTYARTFEIINGYTLEFEDAGLPYTVSVTGGNNNLADVYVPGSSGVSLISNNSAGLVTVSTGGGGTGPTPAQVANAVWTSVNRTITEDPGAADHAATQAALMNIPAQTVAQTLEGSLSVADVMRVLLAVAAGNATVPTGPGSFAFRDNNNNKDRVTGTVDASGARTVTGIDGG